MYVLMARTTTTIHILVTRINGEKVIIGAAAAAKIKGKNKDESEMFSFLLVVLRPSVCSHMSQ